MAHLVSKASMMRAPTAHGRLSTSSPAPFQRSVVPVGTSNRSKILPPAGASVKEFLDDLSGVPGKIRFISIGENCILESVSEFSK